METGLELLIEQHQNMEYFVHKSIFIIIKALRDGFLKYHPQHFEVAGRWMSVSLMPSWST